MLQYCYKSQYSERQKTVQAFQRSYENAIHQITKYNKEGKEYHADINTLVLQNFLIEVPYTDCLWVINLKKARCAKYDVYHIT